MKKFLIYFFLFSFLRIQIELDSKFYLSSKNVEKPDLTIKFHGPSFSYPGENIKNKIKILIKNRGGEIAENLFLDILIEKNNGKEILCGRSFIGVVRPSEDIFPSGLIPTIPLDLEPGVYKICAFVDSENSIEEENEKNNKLCQPIQILEKKVFQKKFKEGI